jgi:hypothetical protein
LSPLLLVQLWSSHFSWYVLRLHGLEPADTFQLFCAWLAGARFDIAYTQFKSEFGKLMGVLGFDNNIPAQITEVHETLNKSEL